jgi:uncharacterized protein
MRAAVLGALFMGISLAYPSFADRRFAKEVGPVAVTGRGGEPHRILINGQVFAEDKDTWSLSIDDAFPNDQDPKWVLLGYGTGGNACEGTYRVLDLSGPSPKLSDEFGNCRTYTVLKTPTQAVFDFHEDTWVYSSRGLTKMPTLNAEENLRQGVDAYKAGHFDLALRYLWPLREKKNPEAPYYLGLMAHMGKGLPQDYKQTMEYYGAAANMGYAPAMFRMGSLHANGLGVPKDMAAANRMYKQAALLGDGTSQYALGLNILAGSGALKAPKEALLWLLLAKERLADSKRLDAVEKNIRAAEALMTADEATKVKSSTHAWKPAEIKLFSKAPELRAWIGKHPAERINGHAIYDVDELKFRLKIELGDDVAAKLPKMLVADKVIEQDGWLLLHGCTPHMCNTSHYTLAIDLATYSVMACVRHEARDGEFLTYGGTGALRSQQLLSNSDGNDCGGLDVAGLKARLSFPGAKTQRTATALPPPAILVPSGPGNAIDTTGTVVTNNRGVEGCRAPGGCAGNGLNQRQTEIMQIVLSPDGYITPELHAEFWSFVPPEVHNNAAARAAFLKVMEAPIANAVFFQRETWASIKSSLTAKRIVKTTRYEEAKQAALSTLLEFQVPAQHGIANAEGMIRAAAEGKPFQSDKGPFYITTEVVEKVLAGLDGAVARMKLLSDPEWKVELKETRYPSAHVATLSAIPFSVEHNIVMSENGQNAKLTILSNQIDETDFVGISFADYGAVWPDPERAIIQTAKAALSSTGAIPFGNALLMWWRGRRSATTQGRSETSQGTLFISVRVVELPEYKGALILTSTSGRSKIEADFLLESLERSTQVID